MTMRRIDDDDDDDDADNVKGELTTIRATK